MGRCETARTSIGIKIVVKDLVDMINEENYETIRDKFFSEDSLIDDENGCYNSSYTSIIRGEIPGNNPDCETDVNELDCDEYKKYLEKSFKEYGDIDMFKDGSEIVNNYKEDDKDNLYHQTILIPQTTLLSTDRWGYNREGTNGKSVDVESFDINLISEEIKERMKMLNIGIDMYKIVLIVLQHSG